MTVYLDLGWWLLFICSCVTLTCALYGLMASFLFYLDCLFVGFMDYMGLVRLVVYVDFTDLVSC